jgi:hypothetical protein
LNSLDVFNYFAQYLVAVDSTAAAYDSLPFGFRSGRRSARKHGTTNISSFQLLCSSITLDIGKKFEVLEPEFENDSRELERQTQWDEQIRPTATQEIIRLEEDQRAAYEQRRAENLSMAT